MKNRSKVKDWVAAINDAGLRPPEGWCHPHRYGSFAPPRGLIEDGSQAQWFIDGRAAFEAIASAIEAAKSEVCFSTALTFRPTFVTYEHTHLYIGRKVETEREREINGCFKDYAQLLKYSCRYLSVGGGCAQNCIYGDLFTLMLHQGLIICWKEKLSKGFR